ncbi:cupin domain-containing protein [Acinetobacter baumannii]
MTTILFRIDDNTVFTSFTPVAEPIGEPLSMTRTALETETEDALLGVWECTPGKWRRQVLQAEYSYFLSGQGRFLHDNGEITVFKAGDGIFFPANSTGIWEIEHTVRKSYVIFK